jgi:hypothetical protein
VEILQAWRMGGQRLQQRWVTLCGKVLLRNVACHICEVQGA